jgi:hypothetical protein
MTDEAKKQADENADLKRRIEALEAKVSPPKSNFVPESDEEHRDRMDQLAEKRMSLATPPSVIRDWNVLDDALCAGIRGDRHAPTGPAGSAIPSSQQVSNVRTGGGSSTPGWVDPIPLSNPPGIQHVDALCIADDVRQRAELKRKLGE